MLDFMEQGFDRIEAEMLALGVATDEYLESHGMYKVSEW